MVSEHFKG